MNTELFVNIGGWGTVVFICLGLYKVANGQLQKKINKDECYIAHTAVDRRIDDLEKHIDTRIDDLKDFIKNGD